MAVTVASLVTKMGYDDDELKSGLNAASGLLGSAMGGLTAIIEAGAVAAATAFGAIAESYMKVQDALTPVMTLTGENTQQFKDMSAAIKDVIASSPRSADDIGMAAYKILSSGITDATQANLALVASNQLALAGLGSVTQASDLISSAMAVWKDSALSADDAAKTFFGTIQVGKTTTAELASGFGTIAPLAAIAGLSLNDLMSATAALTVTGMPAATAYTNLRNILTNVLKPTKQAAEEAKSLGIEFNTSALKGEGLRAFLQDIWAKTQGDPDKIAKLFGNVRGLTGAIALMGPEADAYATDIDSINEKGQLLGERAGEVAGTFSNRIKEMKNAVMVYLADLGQKGLDWFSAKWKVWGDDVSANASHFKDNLIAIFVAIKNHFVDFASGWMSSSADSPSGFFENLGSIARGVYEELLSLFRVLKTSFLDFVTGWSDGAEGSPSGFWQNLGSQAEQVGQGILDLFHDIKIGFLDFINGWESSGPDSPSGFFENLGSKAAGIRNDLLQWFANIKTAYQDFLDGFNSGTYDRPGSPSGFFQNLGDKAADAKNKITDIFNAILTAYNDFVTGWQSGTYDRPGSPTGFFENFGDKASDAKNKVTDAFNTLQTSYHDFVTGWESGTYDRPGSPTGFFENLGHVAKTADDTIKNALKDIQKLNDMSSHEDDKGKKDSGVYKFSIIVNQIGLDVVSGLLWSVRMSMRIINEEIIPAGDLIWGGFSGILTQEVGPALGLIGHLSSDVVGPALDGMKGIITEEIVPALDLLGRSVSTGGLAPLKILNAMIHQEIIPAFWLLVGAVTGAGNATIAALGWLKDNITGIFSGAGSWLYNAGREIIQGLINGIHSMLGNLWGALKVVTGGISIHKGPPEVDRRLLFPVGEMIMSGFIRGIDSQTANLYRHLQDITKNTGTTMHVSAAGFKGSSSVVNYGAPGSVVINMPHGSNGEDVVRALRNWSRANGRVPIAVTGRSA